MNRIVESWTFTRAITIALLILTLTGCSDSLSDKITVRGTVLTIDDGSPAAGVRVALLGTRYSALAPTDAAGAYEIILPSGTLLQLTTDDFESTSDLWVPLINVDVPPFKANLGLTGWVIHCCRNTICDPPNDTDGFVAAWDFYLEDEDLAAGDMFVPTSSASSSGILLLTFFECSSSRIELLEGMAVTSGVSAFPIGFVQEIPLPGYPPCQLGNRLLLPSTTLVTGSAGSVLSFGDPAFTGTGVTLTVADTNSSRAYSWTMRSEIPVRPGTVSLVRLVAIDGVTDKTYSEAAIACGTYP